MTIVRAVSFACLFGAGVMVHAQDAGYQTVTSMVQPSINSISQMMGQIRADKWKLSNESRDQMASYVASINKDLNTTLPALLADADASKGAPEKVLAVSRNVDALYDVLLRVAATSEVASPGQQAQVVEQQVLALRDARQALDDRIERGVQMQAKMIGDLRQQLASAKAAPAPACAAPAPVKKKKAKK